MKLYRFKVSSLIVDFSGESFSFPLVDDAGKLVGGFTVTNFYEGMTTEIEGYVAGVEHPAALRISTGEPCYFTPIFEPDGRREWISGAIISELSINALSTEIETQEIENDDKT